LPNQGFGRRNRCDLGRPYKMAKAKVPKYSFPAC